MHGIDINLASFFSLHRPLNPTKPFPPSAEQSTFDQIFEPSSSAQPKNPSDVVSTLNDAIESLDQAANDRPDGGLHWQVVQESPSNNDGRVHHLDGVPRTKTLEEVVAQLKPYHAPKAPQPLDAAQSQRKQAAKSTSAQKASQQEATSDWPRDRSFQTTIVIRETTGRDGAKYYTAQSTPVVQIPDSSATTESEVSEPASQSNPLRQIREAPNQPFRNRMRQKSWRFVRERMQAISVKRQRKLKMKKHKYKKLMKRTRNLRRRLDRT